MNFADMLLGKTQKATNGTFFSTLVKQVARPFRAGWDKTPTQVEKHKAAKRSKRNAKYAEAFKHFGGVATTKQIADHFGWNGSGLASKLRSMSEEDVPLVQYVGKVPNGNSRHSFLWKWIGPSS